MTVLEFENLFEQIAPLSYAQDWDNVGLLIGDRARHVKKVLCVLDINMDVAIEAIEQGVDIIVAHHPLIFGNVCLTDQTPQGKIILKLMQNNIAVYAAHTNLDSVCGGINDFVASQMGLNDIMPLNPNIKNDNDKIQKTNSTKDGQKPQNLGIGRVGNLQSPTNILEYKNNIAKIFDDKYTSIIGDNKKTIKRVAVVNGSGGDCETIDLAIKANADCFVTAEVKHHIALYAISKGIAIIEPHHFNMEFVYMNELARLLNSLFTVYKIDAVALLSKVENDYRT